jgi:hypothetical protein
MKPTVNIQSKKIELSIPISSPNEDLKNWKMLTKSTLFICLNRKVDIITIEPQKYSTGQEIGNCEKYFLGKSKYLINKEIVLSHDLIELLTDSEDFERGLLLIIQSGSPTLVIEHLTELDKSGAELIVLGDDGKSLIWYNPSSDSDLNAVRGLCEKITVGNL